MSEQGHAAPPVGDRPPPLAAWRRWSVAAGIGACLAAGSFAAVLLLFGGNETTLLVTEWTERMTHPAAAVAPPPAPSAHPPAETTAPQAADAATLSQRAATPAAAQPAAASPTFDIVRVAPSGSSVIAGRSAPNAEVVVSNNGAAIGHAQADAQGDWVIVPAAPIAPGGSELTLQARAPDGSVAHGDSPVIVLVPPVATAAREAVPAPALPPVVLLAPPDAPPRLLQSPAETSPPGTPSSKSQLGLDVVDYDDRGAIRFAGRAPAGAGIRLYIDRQAAGDARSDGLGRWSLTPERTVDPGAHQLRVDQLSETGRVAARIELPFQRVEVAAGAPDLAPGQDRVVVQPRQTLWALARHAYGRGVRYTIIYQANREQIRNPDLIYPGQVFAVPAPESRAPDGIQPQAAIGNPMPASSSSVR